jgi:hypothetical protein
MNAIRLISHQAAWYCPETKRAISAHEADGWCLWEVQEATQTRVCLLQIGHCLEYSQADAFLWGRESQYCEVPTEWPIACERWMAIASDQ